MRHHVQQHPAQRDWRAEGSGALQSDIHMETGTTAPVPARGEPSVWMVVPVAVGAVALIWLGVHPPAVLDELFSRAVALLGGGAL